MVRVREVVEGVAPEQLGVDAVPRAQYAAQAAEAAFDDASVKKYVARIGLAKQVKRGRKLSPKQMTYARRMSMKYWRQLLAAIEAKTAKDVHAAMLDAATNLPASLRPTGQAAGR